ASMNPAKEVGGDFYDFFLIDDSHLGIVMADVSGKGVPAALFMMVSKILVQNYAMMGLSPKEVLEATNLQICANNPDELFGTDRMIEALNISGGDSPKDILGVVRAAVDDFVKEAPQFDDLTMLCLEYKGNGRLFG
ncbi:MAG: SpoIIE family protein phosphatase, partial [Eubacterium sp.]|nr:SpoIIE family protein phosphatase [Eubacterium sp.]